MKSSICKAIWVVAWLAIGCFGAQAQPYQAHIKTAQIWVTLDGQPEHEVPSLQTLPWKWDEHYPKQRGVARFSLQFRLEPHQYASAKLHSQGLGMSALNMGNRYRYQINQSGWQYVGWNEATTQYKVKPRWHSVPAELLMLGVNTIELELKMEPANDAGLSMVEIGDAAQSMTRFQSELEMRHNSMVLVSSFSFLLALLAIGMWVVTKEPLFLWAFLSDSFFAARQLSGFVDYPPIPTWLWNSGLGILFAMFVGFTFKIAELLVPKPSRVINKMIMVYLGLCAPVLLLGNALGDFRFYRAWLTLMTVLTMLLVARVTWFAFRTKDFNLRLYTIAAWMAMVLGWYDLVFIQLSESGLGKMRLGSYTTILFNVGLAIIVIRTYIRAKQDLFESHVRSELEKTKATLTERQRIMADIHDTVGAQLVGVLDLIRTGAPREQLEAETTDALEDLRIAIDAIQPVNGSLTAVLATLRHRLEPRLEMHGIQLLWHVEALPRLANLTPQIIQHIQRIVLEAVSNVMKHAKARTITFTAQSLYEGRTVAIQITDDGLGFDEATLTSAGQGLSTMRFRSEAIGATLAFSKALPCGTRLTLTLPVV